MKIKQYILFILSAFYVSSAINAQGTKQFNCYSYDVNDGLMQSTIINMEFDKNNFCWLSFPNGIQKFDGKTFTNVPIQPGLPDDKLALLFRCNNGDLLISHSQGISKYEINTNQFRQVYTFHAGEKTTALFIGETENTIYFYHHTGTITGIDTKTYQPVSEKKITIPYVLNDGFYRPKFSDNIINHKTGMLVNRILYLWDLQKGALLSQSAPIAGISKSLLRLKTDKEVLYYDSKIASTLQLYDFTAAKKSTLFIKRMNSNIIYQGTIFPWQNKMLISFSNQIYETDSTFQTLKNELVNFQNKPIAGDQPINSIKEDNFGNLYLQTVKGGIKKIIRNHYPFKYYGAGKPDSSYIITIFPDKRSGIILAGTADNGLLVFDTLQHLIKHIKTLPGSKQAFNVNTILETNNGNYLLFIGNAKQVWELSHNLSQLKSITITSTLPENKRGTDYFGNFLFQNEKEAVVQSQSNLYQVDFATNTVTEHAATTGYTMSGIALNKTIITHTNNELIFLDASTFKEIKKIPFKNTGNVRCFTKDSAGNVFVGSNKGIFKIDNNGNVLQQFNKETGLPDECIYAMCFDEEGYLWCSSNKGIFKIKKDGSLQQFKKENGLQENEFNTNSVAQAEDGELFFGGINGMNSFYPSAINTQEEKPQIFLASIAFNNKELFTDTAVSAINKIELPYDKNSLSFNFIAMGRHNPDEYIYQYRMDGIDVEWLPTNASQAIHYFLPPGSYILKIYAGPLFDKNAVALKELIIVIHPPFWKSWWFVALISLLLLSCVAFAINRYVKKKYQKKLEQLEAEHKVQMERERISRDLHDNIGAYANAILYNTELLQKQVNPVERDKLMNDLKHASKDIITSLRDTVWALKKEEYTAQDCLLRIRNFIQPFNRYYETIRFTVEGEAPEETYLHYTHALNMVRIIQEAVTNAIKHASASFIKVASKTENGKWIMAVEDNGNGFDYNNPDGYNEGNGLDNMKQRSADSNFGFHINSNKGRGTIITILMNH